MKHELFPHLCPRFQAVMDVLARPWNGLIMGTLGAAGPMRFSELRAHIDAIGDRMLSARLKELEARGLIARNVVAGPPVKVEYALTEVGRGFPEVAMAMSKWGARFAAAPNRARLSGDVRRKRAREARRSTAP